MTCDKVVGRGWADEAAVGCDIHGLAVEGVPGRAEKFDIRICFVRHKRMRRPPLYPAKGSIRKSAVLAILRDGFLTSFGRFSGISDHTFGLDGQFQGRAGSNLRQGAYYYDSAKNLTRRFFVNSVPIMPKSPTTGLMVLDNSKNLRKYI